MAEKEGSAENVKVVRLPLSSVQNNPLNPRRADNPRYHAIVESLRVKGINDTPIDVYESPEEKGTYLTFAGGGTRLKALKEIGAPEVRCIIREQTDEATVIANHLNENSCRGEASFADTALSTVDILVRLGKDGKSATIRQKKEILASYGIPVGIGSLSLYERAVELLGKWKLFPYLSKRSVESFAQRWAGAVAVITTYEGRTPPTKVLLEKFLHPCIEERNSKIGMTATGESAPVFDSNHEASANLQMELQLLFKAVSNLVESTYTQAEEKKSGANREAAADFIRQQVIQATSTVNAQQTPQAANARGGATSANERVSAQIVQARERRFGGIGAGVSTDASAEVSAERIQSSQRDESGQTDVEIKTQQLMLYRERVAEVIAGGKTNLSERKEPVDVTLSADLAAELYAFAMGPFPHMVKTEQERSMRDGIGRLHQALFGSEINLDEIYLAAEEAAKKKGGRSI